MTSIDYRNAKWENIQATLQGRRLEVLEAWRQHGPGTTRAVATASGIDILTLRPRTTDLLQLGLLVEVEGDDAGGHEGTYQAIPMWQAMQRFHDRVKEAQDAQLNLKL